MDSEGLQKIEEVENPLVGRTYLVKCYHVSLHPEYMRYNLESEWLPVFGPRHEDSAFFKFPRDHYHHDSRFFSDHDLKILVKTAFRGRIDAPELYDISEYEQEFMKIVESTATEKDLKVIPKMMHRFTPDFPLIPERNALEEHFKEHVMKCMTCPHRKVSLKGTPVRDGVVVCPGHGLAWNLETGKLVPRKKK